MSLPLSVIRQQKHIPMIHMGCRTTAPVMSTAIPGGALMRKRVTITTGPAIMIRTWVASSPPTPSVTVTVSTCMLMLVMIPLTSLTQVELH
ncbi:MAG TPA: hypothetical protein PK690_11090 [Emcibacteraceae bacterium]|nr:hypothetical protein [Emcibacteraceae bacterium]